ncbi:conserved hypothetical protein [Shewanella sediminis HAW-EB3]|uniref:Uncharacterized protein n=1 Tax=Shewanella sediminis (strain HAW-EB3) TaxID=425104 RepID=A8FR12_SHESH|nr:hypothetical protein [Shewanella sediminis]ABV35285.1 conserved hypothetical protein [Shewanella sediminis HAW-EB3]
MSDQFICWHCGNVLEEVILPMSRREGCGACGADQHVCKMCVFFNDSGRGDCREERAEWVSDRERANFCDYFKLSEGGTDTYAPGANEQALAELAELFGDTPPSEPDEKEKEMTPAEIAEKQLRDLLG